MTQQNSSKSPLMLGFAVFPFAGVIAMFGWRRSPGVKKLFLSLVLAMVSLGAVFAVSACGGSGSNKQASSGTYVIPVTVTAGSAVTTVNMVVVVQ
jgi:hypothetical protein